MRYDTPVYFQRITTGAYDPSTGDYGPDGATETEVWASVLPTQRETLRLLYGELRQDSVTIHIQNRYEGLFDRVRIGNKVYRVDSRRGFRVKESFVLSEVP